MQEHTENVVGLQDEFENSSYLPLQVSMPISKTRQFFKGIFRKSKKPEQEQEKEIKQEQEKPSTLKEQGPPTKEQIIDLLRIYRAEYMILRENQITSEVSQAQFEKEIGDKLLNKGLAGA